MSKACASTCTTARVTSATARQHGTQEASWRLTIADGQAAPDGEYKLRVEVTDRDGVGQVLTVAFTKSGEPLHLTPEDSPYFDAVELTCS